MADGILDFAGLDAAASAVENTNNVVDAPQEADGVSTPAEGVDNKTTEGELETTEGADGSPKDTDDLPGDKNTPDNIRKALKTFRDADPKNRAVVNTLHGSYERWEAAKAIFPKGVNEMREAKEFIDLVGGVDGFEKLQSTVSDIEETYALLSSGDAKLIDGMVEDLKAEGKIEALGKLTGPWLDAVKKNDPDGYYAAFEAHFVAGLEETRIPEVVAGLLAATAIEAGKEKDPEALAAALARVKAGAARFDKWIKDHQEKIATAKKTTLDPERVKLNQEREAFKKQQEEFKTNQTKEFQNSIGKENDKSSNSALGNALSDYVKLPFFKGFKEASWKDLAGGIRSNLFTTLKEDKAYQTQMKALWGAKTPDRGRILEYHKSKVDSIAKDVVRRTIETRYPGYAKGGAAAGRVAAAQAKKDADTKATQQSNATGKPVYVTVKPEWNAIDWDKDPKQLLYVAGKAYLKNGGKFVTWRKA